MYVVDTKTSSAVNAPASVAMSAVVQVSIHRHYRLHLVQKSIHRPYPLLLVQVLIDYHYLLRLVLAAIHLQPITVSPSIDPFSLFPIDRQYPVLVVKVSINHYYCHSSITTTIASPGIDPSSLTSTAATASRRSPV